MLKRLIVQNRLKEALELLMQQASTVHERENILMLFARLNRMERDVQLGVISRPQANVERAKIVQAMLYYSNIVGKTVTSTMQYHVARRNTHSTMPTINMLELEDWIDAYFLKRDDIVEQAEALKIRFINYEAAKKIRKTYDAYGDELEQLEADFQMLKKVVQRLQRGGHVEIIEAVEQLFSNISSKHIPKETLYAIATELEQVELLRPRVREAIPLIDRAKSFKQLRTAALALRKIWMDLRRNG